MIDAGSDAICLLANFSEQFGLSDTERDQVFAVSMEHITGRVPVIYTASHFSARVTADRCRRAEAGGASAIMLMPPYHGATIRVGDDAIRAYFATVAAATELPIIIQDSPVSGTPLSVDLLASLAETIPTIAYFKLETLDATVKIAGAARSRRSRDPRARSMARKASISSLTSMRARPGRCRAR